MNIKKPLLVAGVASTITMGGLAGGSVVSAATSSGPPSGGPSDLVDAIASKFHLNKSEVQEVLDQNREKHEAQRQQKFEDRLDQAVKDGKITNDQKDQILAKQKELKSYMDSIKDKTPEERHKLMKAKLDEVKKWAEDNDISMKYLRLGHGHGGPRGHDDR